MDMLSIFEDDRRHQGAKSPGPKGVRPKSPLNASQMLDDGLRIACALLLFRSDFGHELRRP